CRREPVPVAIRDQHITGRAGATVRLPVVRSRRQALVAERIGPAVTATGGRPARPGQGHRRPRSEEHTSELQSRENLVCRLLLENSPAAPQISTLSLHDALPILPPRACPCRNPRPAHHWPSWSDSPVASCSIAPASACG